VAFAGVLGADGADHRGGRAQERAWVFRTQKRRNPATGKEYLWLTSGQITYDLRRLRVHGLIERIPRTHR
jgi:hypothetical protein